MLNIAKTVIQIKFQTIKTYLFSLDKYGRRLTEFNEFWYTKMISN